MEGDCEAPLQYPHTLDISPLRYGVVGECRSDGGRLRNTPTTFNFAIAFVGECRSEIQL